MSYIYNGTFYVEKINAYQVMYAYVLNIIQYEVFSSFILEIMTIVKTISYGLT